MSRLAFVFRTDVHVADKSPASWKADYPAEIFNNLIQIGEIATAKGAVTLDGGDFFHHKSAIRNSHGLVTRVVKIHDKYPKVSWAAKSVYCIEGNHDLHANNLDSVEHQPLGVLYATGVFGHLREEVFEDGDLRVRVVGIPYSPTRTVAEIQEFRKKPGDTHLIAIIHALAGENPPAHVEDFFGEPVFSYRSLIFEGGPDVLAFGHWHRDQGVVQIDGRYFVNQGATSRGALVRDNLSRTPKVSVIEITNSGINIETVPLKVAPPEEVYDVERKAREESESKAITQFVEQIQDELKVDDSTDIPKAIDALSFAPEVRKRALKYLEDVR